MKCRHVALAFLISGFFLCGFVGPRERKYVEYFLHLYSADLFKEKNFNLTHSRVLYSEKYISSIELSYNCYRLLSINQARMLLVDIVEDLVKKINSDPGLREKGLIFEKFLPTQIILKIQTDNVFSEKIDTMFVRFLTMENGLVTYESYKDMPELWGKRIIKHERYNYSLMLAGKANSFDSEIAQAEQDIPVPEERVQKVPYPSDDWNDRPIRDPNNELIQNYERQEIRRRLNDEENQERFTGVKTVELENYSILEQLAVQAPVKKEEKDSTGIKSTQESGSSTEKASSVLPQELKSQEIIPQTAEEPSSQMGGKPEENVELTPVETVDVEGSAKNKEVTNKVEENTNQEPTNSPSIENVQESPQNQTEQVQQQAPQVQSEQKQQEVPQRVLGPLVPMNSQKQDVLQPSEMEPQEQANKPAEEPKPSVQNVNDEALKPSIQSQPIQQSPNSLLQEPPSYKVKEQKNSSGDIQNQPAIEEKIQEPNVPNSTQENVPTSGPSNNSSTTQQPENSTSSTTSVQGQQALTTVSDNDSQDEDASLLDDDDLLNNKDEISKNSTETPLSAAVAMLLEGKTPQKFTECDASQLIASSEDSPSLFPAPANSHPETPSPTYPDHISCNDQDVQVINEEDAISIQPVDMNTESENSIPCEQEQYYSLLQDPNLLRKSVEDDEAPEDAALYDPVAEIEIERLSNSDNTLHEANQSQSTSQIKSNTVSDTNSTASEKCDTDYLHSQMNEEQTRDISFEEAISQVFPPQYFANQVKNQKSSLERDSIAKLDKNDVAPSPSPMYVDSVVNGGIISPEVVEDKDDSTKELVDSLNEELQESTNTTNQKDEGKTSVDVHENVLVAEADENSQSLESQSDLTCDTSTPDTDFLTQDENVNTSENSEQSTSIFSAIRKGLSQLFTRDDTTQVPSRDPSEGRPTDERTDKAIAYSVENQSDLLQNSLNEDDRATSFSNQNTLSDSAQNKDKQDEKPALISQNNDQKTHKQEDDVVLVEQSGENGQKSENKCIVASDSSQGYTSESSSSENHQSPNKSTSKDFLAYIQEQISELFSTKSNTIHSVNDQKNDSHESQDTRLTASENNHDNVQGAQEYIIALSDEKAEETANNNKSNTTGSQDGACLLSDSEDDNDQENADDTTFIAEDITLSNEQKSINEGSSKGFFASLSEKFSQLFADNQNATSAIGEQQKDSQENSIASLSSEDQPHNSSQSFQGKAIALSDDKEVGTQQSSLVSDSADDSVEKNKDENSSIAEGLPVVASDASQEIDQQNDQDVPSHGFFTALQEKISNLFSRTDDAPENEAVSSTDTSSSNGRVNRSTSTNICTSDEALQNHENQATTSGRQKDDVQQMYVGAEESNTSQSDDVKEHSSEITMTSFEDSNSIIPSQEMHSETVGEERNGFFATLSSRIAQLYTSVQKSLTSANNSHDMNGNNKDVANKNVQNATSHDIASNADVRDFSDKSVECQIDGINYSSDASVEKKSFDTVENDTGSSQMLLAEVSEDDSYSESEELKAYSEKYQEGRVNTSFSQQKANTDLNAQQKENTFSKSSVLALNSQKNDKCSDIESQDQDSDDDDEAEVDTSNAAQGQDEGNDSNSDEDKLSKQVSEDLYQITEKVKNLAHQAQEYFEETYEKAKKFYSDVVREYKAKEAQKDSQAQNAIEQQQVEKENSLGDTKDNSTMKSDENDVENEAHEKRELVADESDQSSSTGNSSDDKTEKAKFFSDNQASEHQPNHQISSIDSINQHHSEDGLQDQNQEETLPRLWTKAIDEIRKTANDVYMSFVDYFYPPVSQQKEIHSNSDQNAHSSESSQTSSQRQGDTGNS